MGEEDREGEGSTEKSLGVVLGCCGWRVHGHGLSAN